MKIAIHHTENINKDSYSRKWIENLGLRGIEVIPINFMQSDIIHKVTGCSGAMWHWYHLPDDKQAAPKILDAIEFGLKIPVFPNKESRWHFDEKVGQHYLFDAIKAPKIKSWVFWNKPDAENFIDAAKYPIVFKLSVGAGSANVLKINDKTEAQHIIDIMFGNGFTPYSINEFEEKIQIAYPVFYNRLKDCVNYLIKRRLPNISSKPKQHWYYLIQKNYAYFQEFIPENKFDIRITIIGNRAFGFVRHNRDNDFRASGSGKIDYDINKIPLEAVKIAHTISKENNFQSMAYDFLMNMNNEVVLNEICYCYQSKAVYDCSGFWDRELNWHEGHVYPEAAHVEDFITLIDTGKLV